MERFEWPVIVYGSQSHSRRFSLFSFIILCEPFQILCSLFSYPINVEHILISAQIHTYIYVVVQHDELCGSDVWPDGYIVLLQSTLCADYAQKMS